MQTLTTLSPDQTPASRASGVELLWQRLAGAADAAAYCHAWLGLQCAELDQVGVALLLLRDESGAFVPAAVWPDARADVAYLGRIAQRCLAERMPVSERIDEPGAVASMYAACPIEEGGELLGAVVLELAPRNDAALKELWRTLHWGSGRIEALLLRRQLEQRQATEERARLSLEMAVSVAEEPQFERALMQLAIEVARRLDCERVAVGVERRGRIRLRALSNAAWFERKSEFAVALENAMEEACDQGRSVVYPPLPGYEGAIAVAHREIARHGAACTVVIALRGRVIGALTCLSQTPRDADFVAAVEAAAALLAPNLLLRRELHRWFAGRVRDALHAFWRGCRDPRRPSFRVGSALVLLLLLWLGFATGEYRVTGQAVIEGELQRSIVAPFDGFIADAAVRAGQRVAAGDVLATLDDRDLLLDQQKWQAQGEQANRKYRDALAKHDRANARILAAQLAEARAQVALVEDKLARARISAPFDGVVVSGDLSQMLGTPVEKGKVLFEIAPLDAYRVILKVPESDIRAVRTGQQGLIVLAGMSDEQIPFTVKNIGVAAAEEGENFFRVEAATAGTGPGLRPGMEGVGKIVIGERRLLWVWTHRFVDWLGLKLWYWLP
jgi:hypothetical protein